VSEEDPYLYSGTSVLRNSFDIRDAAYLEYVEREIVLQRAREGIPTGNFDLAHLCAIHRHLFQDIYDWAGQVRTLEIAKGGSQFQFRRFIETGMIDIHRRLVHADFLKGLNAKDFAAAAGQIMGDVNYVHPFREGNGRTQLYYLQQLALQAGHPIDLGVLDPERWLAASKAAHMGNYTPMGDEIRRALIRLA
jgi:cell filamentation protein